MDSLFDLILKELDERGLLVKKGTSVDATIIKPTTRPLFESKRSLKGMQHH